MTSELKRERPRRRYDSSDTFERPYVPSRKKSSVTWYPSRRPADGLVPKPCTLRIPRYAPASMSFALILGTCTSRRSTCAGITGSGICSGVCAAAAVGTIRHVRRRKRRVIDELAICLEEERRARGQLVIVVRAGVVDQRDVPLGFDTQEELARYVVAQADARVGQTSARLDRADERRLRLVLEAACSEREERRPARVRERLRYD